MGAYLAYVDENGQLLLFGISTTESPARPNGGTVRHLARIEFLVTALAVAVEGSARRRQPHGRDLQRSRLHLLRRLEAENDVPHRLSRLHFLMPIASLHQRRGARRISVGARRSGRVARLMAGDDEKISAKECQHPVDATSPLAMPRHLGTPTLVAADGRVLTGTAAMRKIGSGRALHDVRDVPSVGEGRSKGKEAARTAPPSRRALFAWAIRLRIDPVGCRTVRTATLQGTEGAMCKSVYGVYANTGQSCNTGDAGREECRRQQSPFGATSMPRRARTRVEHLNGPIARAETLIGLGRTAMAFS